MSQNEISKIVQQLLYSTETIKQSAIELLDSPAEQSLKDNHLDELKERERRWHSVSNSQLSYFNNILIAFGAGFIGYVIKDPKPPFSSTLIQNNCESKLIIVISVCIMGASVFVGLCCAYNRILDFRHTFRENKFKRKFFEKNPSEYEKRNINLTEDDHKFKPGLIIVTWFKMPWYCEIADSEYLNNVCIVSKKIFYMRLLLRKLGRWTWKLFGFEMLLFVLSLILYIIYGFL